jgi:hypothetical protein
MILLSPERGSAAPSPCPARAAGWGFSAARAASHVLECATEAVGLRALEAPWYRRAMAVPVEVPLSVLWSRDQSPAMCDDRVSWFGIPTQFCLHWAAGMAIDEPTAHACLIASED